jgi:NTE family protein
MDLSGLMLYFRKLYAGELSLEQFRAEVGAFALAAEAVSEEEWLATFGSINALQEWPERPFVCTAIDTADGALVTWGKDSGVELRLAVASSCAVPGIVGPVTINGRRYMDGGIGTTTNASFAKGYDRVLIVSVVGGASRTAAANPALAAAVAERAERELQDVRDGGSEVELIVPDDEAREVMGMNVMDGSKRAEIAQEGQRQGRAEAARLKEWWA